MAGSIILIGMPGVGKSTVGVLLAKRLGLSFVDTDLIIQTGEGMRLQTIIEKSGIKGFFRIEETYIRSLDPTDGVIATGGSVVYSAAAMAHLKSDGIVIHLDLEPSLLEQRLGNMDERGVVHRPDQSLKDLFIEREPLYRRYRDIYIDCGSMTPEGVLRRILSDLDTRP